MLMPRFEPSTSVSRNRHSYHMTNIYIFLTNNFVNLENHRYFFRTRLFHTDESDCHVTLKKNKLDWVTTLVRYSGNEKNTNIVSVVCYIVSCNQWQIIIM